MTLVGDLGIGNISAMSLHVPGIYAIIHRETRRVYVGCSNSCKRRWYEHRSNLRRGSHPNAKLQRAWLKHGEAAFDFRLVQRVEQIADLARMEQFWIDRFNPWFNIERQVNPDAGRRRAPETIAKTAAANRGRKRTAEALENIRRSHKTRAPMTPETEAAWREKLRDAWRRRDYRRDPAIGEKSGEKLRGRPLSEEHCRKLSEAHKGKGPSREAIEKSRQARIKEWVFINPEGEVVRIRNLQELCRQHGLNSGCMQSVNNGSRPQHKDWKRYLESVE